MNGFFYGLLWVVVRGIARIYFRLRIEGAGRVPRSGGFLIAANHASYLDIPLLGCGVRRRLWYMGRRDLFPVPGTRWLFRALGWIPIRPDRLDRQGFNHAIDLIKRGQAVVIYPEGGRTASGELRRGKPGVGLIVAQTKCRVVPVHIDGTYAAMPPGQGWPKPHRVTLRFGEAMEFDDVVGTSEKAFYHEVSRRVMARIAELGGIDAPKGHHHGVDGASAASPSRPAPVPLHAERGPGLS